ncbi:MAG: hypothetical protein Q9220_007827 [cf. Caloplaca sp. 1 TL-2023]
MTEPRRSSRRLSARLGDKEDVPPMNGVMHGGEKGKHGQSTGSSTKQGKAGVNGVSSTAAGAKAKRKLGMWSTFLEEGHRLPQRAEIWSFRSLLPSAQSDVVTTDDEDSDGFRFTRTRAKKAKAEPAPQIQPIEEGAQEDTPKPAPVRKTRKRTSGSPNEAGAIGGEKPERRSRRARNSGDKGLVEEETPAPPLAVKKKRKPKDDGGQGNRERKESDAAASAGAQAAITTEPARIRPIDRPLDPIKVSLPFADTPIIRRNKEMRKGAENGSRRSSLGMRGRRASSLIDSGKSDALPHDEVPSEEFYKHIESSLTEPRRMRQLLTWCGTRALGDKPSSTQKDFQARQAGKSSREIQQQLLKDFSNKSEMSDWFNRNQKEITPPPSKPQPNPKNVSNEAKIKDLEQQIALLQTERQTWETLLRPPSEDLSLSPLSSNPDPHAISTQLLASPTQTAVLTALQSFYPPSATAADPEPKESRNSAPATTTNDLQTSTLSRLRNIIAGPSSSDHNADDTNDNNNHLEFTVDTFATNVHALNSYKATADRVGGEVLAISAEALEERERLGRRRGGGGEDGETEEVGMRDVLRGLSRVA